MSRLLRAVKRTDLRCTNFCHSTAWLCPPSLDYGHQTKVQLRFKTYEQSYTHSTGTKPMIGQTIGNMVDQLVDKYGDREALVDCRQQIRKTFTQYKEDIDQLAMGFLALNLKKGDRVGIWSPNRYEWALVQLATAKAGLILVTLNPAYQPPELEYCMKKMEIKAMVAQDQFKIQDYYKMLTTVVPEIAKTKSGTQIKSKKHPYLDTIILLSEKDLPGSFKFSDVMKAGGSTEKRALEEMQNKIDISDPAMAQFTSGTTGAPKASLLPHHGLVNGTYTMSDKLGFDNKYRRLCGPVPLFHVFGSLGVVLMSLFTGNCCILPSPGFDSTEVLRCIETEKCDAVNGTPTMFIDILRNPTFNDTNLSTLTKVMMSGAPCPPYLLKGLMEKLNTSDITSGYGATELTGGCCFTAADDSVEDKLHTVGRPYDYLEAKVVDRNGAIVPIGTPGEICIRGYKVMLGYWGDKDKTREVITDDGWYKTGDVGIMDTRGYLKLTDRVKDMIIRGGENIYPAELENFLMSHPMISEVQVIGVPDDRMGEEVCAWIILKPNQTLTETELKEFCKGKIAHFKIPRYVQFVDKLPTTLSGKVQKFKLREKMQEILGLAGKKL